MTSQIFRIVFEDKDIMVVEKLRPFLSQRGELGDQEGLFEFIARTTGQPILPVHRLDKDVLGLMIFAKNKKSAEALSEQFKLRSVEKNYEAKVGGRVFNDQGTLIHYLKKNPKTNYVTVFTSPTEGAKRAELDYRVLERGDGWTKLQIKLKTGRTHQIRVQLKKMGHPIIGDSKYGGKDEGGLICLRSVFLSVIHPTTAERLEWRL